MAQKDIPAQPGDPAASPATTISIPLVEADGLQPIYANFVKINPAFEELVLDFGLNPNSPGAPPVPIKISQRVVMNYYTAKRLSMHLANSIQRHEQAFGVLEIDVGKRVLPQPQPPAR